MQDTSTSPIRATRREWLGLAVIALPCMLYSMDLTVLNLAIPRLSADLKPSSSELLWILDIYGFFVAGSLITMGTLGDRIGRRKLLLIGAACFGITSILAAFANTAPLLIAARALLGIAGATLAPSTLSLIRAMFHDEQQRSVAISIWITSYSVGAMIGPFVGGLLLQHFWWGSVFLAGVPVMVLLLILGPMLLPEYKDPDAGILDLLSAALSMISVLALIYGLKQLAQSGAWYLSWPPLILGVLVGAAFLRRQRHLTHPFIDLELLRSSRFRTALTLNVVAFFLMFPVFLFVGQYLQIVLGHSPLVAGLWLMPSSIGFVAGSLITPKLLRKWSMRNLLATGLTVSGSSFLVLAFSLGSGSVLAIAIAAFFFSLGSSPVVMTATDLILGSAAPERAGSAASLSETSAEFGGALGIAVVGSLGTVIYRSLMSGPLAGLSTEQAADARDTAGGALDVAAGLSDPGLTAALIEQVRNAFTIAAEWSAFVTAAGTLALAVFVFIKLRSKPASDPI
jgi:DHA2 family multidrug resistance protein-like MFS transporter